MIAETSTLFPVRVWMLIYALSGFIALALEIVWFRLLGVLQKSTAFTFPTLLAVYLGGLAIGVLIGIPLARRGRRPTTVFLALQGGVTLYAGAAFAFFLHHVSRREFLKPLWTYLGRYEPINAADIATGIAAWFSDATVPSALGENTRLGLILYFLVPFVLIAPSTLLMGASFPVLQKLVQNNPALLGRRVGWLQTVNIAGSMLGALVVGWCLLHWLGSAGTLQLLVMLSGVFLCLLAWHQTRRAWSRSVALSISVALVGWIAFLIPTSSMLWARLHGSVPPAIIVRESASGLALLKGEPSGFENGPVWVFTNGIGQSSLPYGDIHTQIGLLAVALHPAPSEVAVIGIGSGDTVYALGGSPHTRELTAIEIVEAVHEVLRELAPRIKYPALDAMLEDSRIRRVFTDGRAYILHGGKQYDVIEADALRPGSAYSGNLYSIEYFEMLRSCLKPNGLALTWAPTGRVHYSFAKVFPYMVLVDGVAIGSQQPIDTDPEAIQRRLADPFTKMHYGRLDRDIQPLLATLLSGKFPRYSPGSDRPGRDLNWDLFPKDEYMIPERQ